MQRGWPLMHTHTLLGSLSVIVKYGYVLYFPVAMITQ